jgi:hypothetical protein
MFICTPKEPEFFCDDAVFARGWGRYESPFAGARGKIAMGEGSTSYTKQMRFPQYQVSNNRADFLKSCGKPSD